MTVPNSTEAKTLADYLALPYTIVLKRDEDGDMMAVIAELNGCRAHGVDEIEAISNLREVKASWLALAIEAGQTIALPLTWDEVDALLWHRAVAHG